MLSFRLPVAHPNTKLFITHGGLLSTQELIYHGVPAVYLPVFGDQDKNGHHATAIGIGKVLEILTLTESQLEEALQEVLGNPRLDAEMDVLHFFIMRETRWN